MICQFLRDSPSESNLAGLGPSTWCIRPKSPVTEDKVRGYRYSDRRPSEGRLPSRPSLQASVAPTGTSGRAESFRGSDCTSSGPCGPHGEVSLSPWDPYLATHKRGFAEATKTTSFGLILRWVERRRG
jgi:hypothetical protein